MIKQKRVFDKLINNFLFKNKSGQTFLIAALIIVLLLYSLTVNYNYVRELVELKDYGELRDNYNKEVPKVANEAIYITTDPSKCKGANPDPHCPLQATQRFAKEYQKYANQKDPNFGLVSIIKDPVTGDIIIQNLLANDVSGSSRYIKIKTTDYTGDHIKLLLSENDKSKGTITLNGIGQVSTSVPVSSFGEGLTNTNVGNAKSFTIELADGTPVTINLESSGTTQVSQILNSKNGQGSIDYDICPPPINPNTGQPYPNRC